jgi:hypothetical protein
MAMAAAIMAGVKTPGSGSFCCCAAVAITATVSAVAAVPVKKLPFLWAPELYGGLSYFAEKKSEYRESSF